MQNDWAKWLLMMKFSENFNIFSIISMISFYFNKEFHSRMSFNSDTTDYEITCELLEARKVDDIVIWMKELLIFDHQQLKKMKQIIEAQINKHKWDVIYEVNDWVWLFSKNIKTTKSCKNLKRQTARILSNHCQSWDFLSFSFIDKHEVAAFDVQFKVITFLFQRLLIRTAFRII